LGKIKFTPPGYYSPPQEFAAPKVWEWSFEIQQPIGAKNVFVATYSGNHGYNLLAINPWTNAFGFNGLPATAPDPRFAYVNQLTNAGWSNYDGVSFQFRRAFSFGFQGEVSYTWSHALDTISNNGSGEPFEFCSGCSFTSLPNPNILAAYGNADYDVRHNMTADFVWDMPWRPGNRWIRNILGNWTVASKFFWRTGTPYSIIDTVTPGLVAGANVPSGQAILATALGPLPTSCSPSAVNTACYTLSQFLPYGTSTAFGNLGRNSIYGPHYADIDTSVYKNFNVTERVRLRFGASAYNLVNHPNFLNPNADIAGSGFGMITGTAIPPTSAYGSFQGSAVSGRVLVVTGRLQF
jgi:hypothetical protein